MDTAQLYAMLGDIEEALQADSALDARTRMAQAVTALQGVRRQLKEMEDTPEPKAAPKAETAPKAEAKAAPEPTATPKAEAKAAPKAEPKAAPKAEASQKQSTRRTH